jgi:hypothetical protein
MTSSPNCLRSSVGNLEGLPFQGDALFGECVAVVLRDASGVEVELAAMATWL